MLCWEQSCHVPAHEGLCTETGLTSEQSPYKSILPLKFFANQSYNLISNHMFWIDFVLSVVSVGYLLPLDKISGAAKWLAMRSSDIFLWNEHFCQRCQPKAQHCCFLKYPNILNHLNHSLFITKSASLLPPLCSGQSVCQMLLSRELRPCSVPGCIPWGLCSPPWTSGEREGSGTAAKLAFHKVLTDF